MSNVDNIGKIISCKCKVMNEKDEKLMYVIPKPILSCLPIVFDNYKISKSSILDLSKIIANRCRLKVDQIETGI